jgi:hypothetical protein
LPAVGRLVGLPCRRLVFRLDQATADFRRAVMADADHGSGVRLRFLGPGLLAFREVGDPLLNLIEAVDNGLVLRLLAVLVDDGVALLCQRVDLLLLLGGRRRPFRRGPAETLVASK